MFTNMSEQLHAPDAKWLARMFLRLRYVKRALTLSCLSQAHLVGFNYFATFCGTYLLQTWPCGNHCDIFIQKYVFIFP